ncbi:hypothetical protein [Komagataeibacter saccharivorans]|uniref:hypothetical protein n=1 Tax=Komagataeibacter saccharivorans TaxID=265959 RepID=UPI0038D20D7B
MTETLPAGLLTEIGADLQIRPNLFYQKENACLPTDLGDRDPLSACFKTNVTCAAVNFDAFMKLSPSPIRGHKWKISTQNDRVSGSEARQHQSTALQSLGL